MTAAARSDVAAQLRAQLDKLRAADPFRALEVTPTVDGDGVRRAFLQLTKRYHPNRFALEDAPTRDLANEVFLLIRKAYDVLLDEEKRKAWRDRVLVSPSAPTQPITRAATGTVLPSATPAARAASNSISPPTSPAARAKTASIPPRQPPPSSSPPASQRPVTVSAPPTTQRPAGPPPRTGNTRPSTAAGAPASPEELQGMLEQARTRGQRFDDAVLLIRQGLYKQAREALYKIAMEDPQNKRYRVQMHLAWGLEHLAESRAAEGQRELERALALDPACQEARDALKKLQEAAKKPGLFGKLFGK